MKTVIVPTDFSPTADNAVRYAAQMIQGVYDTQIILYHVYEKASHKASAESSLQKLKAEILDKNPIKIETIAVEGDDVIDEIERVVRHRQAQFVIMGITGRSELAKVFMGSNTLKLVDRNVCPVLIIPPDARFSGIKNVALTSDFQDVRMTTPTAPIKALLEMFHPALHIINVDSRHYVSLTEEFQKERSQMSEMFSEYNPEFYFIGLYDFHEAINQVVIDKKIDLLVTVPRKHSFLKSLFGRSTTKELVYQSIIPIFAAHE